MSNITVKRLRSTFQAVAVQLPCPDGFEWALEMGSKTHGNTYKMALRDLETGGLSRVKHLGFTKSDAYNYLDGMREALYIQNELKG